MNTHRIIAMGATLALFVAAPAFAQTQDQSTGSELSGIVSIDGQALTGVVDQGGNQESGEINGTVNDSDGQLTGTVEESRGAGEEESGGLTGVVRPGNGQGDEDGDEDHSGHHGHHGHHGNHGHHHWFDFGFIRVLTAGVVSSVSDSSFTIDRFGTGTTTVVTDDDTQVRGHGATSSADIEAGDGVLVLGTLSTSTPGTVVAGFVRIVGNGFGHFKHFLPLFW